MKPAARPSGEISLTLAGSGNFTIPATGLGMCCRPTAYDPESVRRSVLWWLMQGGRLIDTAQLYLNHEWVGQGIAAAMQRGVPRHEIFLQTKLNPRFYTGKGVVEQQVKAWLKELGVEYLDLVLLHHPEGLMGGTCKKSKGGAQTAADCRAEAWMALSALRDEGLVRSLGVSNFSKQQIDELRALESRGGAPIALNQIQYNPFAPPWQHAVVEHCKRHGIIVQAWGLFQGTMFQHESMFSVGTLREIAQRHGRSVPQVLLRWAVEKGITSVPGTGNPKHMVDNLAVYDFQLSSEDVARMDAIGSDPKVDFSAMGFEQNLS
jgi:diketogulonate reductase-like aldo/keto reductase